MNYGDIQFFSTREMMRRSGQDTSCMDSNYIRGKQLGGQDTIELDTITLARIFEADRQRDIILRENREKYERELSKKTAAKVKELIEQELKKIM